MSVSATNNIRFMANAQNFSKIPGSPIAYWVSEAFFKTFFNKFINYYASTNNGFTTGDNDRFLRLWHEVGYGKINFHNETFETLKDGDAKWFPYNKGGNFRKWYGNNEYVINWGNNGAEIKAYGHLVPRSIKYMFRESVSWNKITSGSASFRYKTVGTMFDVGGLSMFCNSHTMLLYLMALCNTVYVNKTLKIISPTMNCETGHVASVPVIYDNQHQEVIVEFANNNVLISKEDWDSYETSWDFKKHPLV